MMSRWGICFGGAEATRAASYVAVVPAIRAQLVEQQQKIGRSRTNLVTEGRDQGTVVFPDAELKFYLDASPQERARRRVHQLRARGELVDPQEILNQILARDHRDSTRATGPLARAADAELVDTTKLTEQEVIDRIVSRGKSLIGSRG
jgi:cytidylate kinase